MYWQEGPNMWVTAEEEELEGQSDCEKGNCLRS